MNLDMNKHETYITAPDDASKVMREAIPPPAQPKVVIPNPTDNRLGRFDGKTSIRDRSSFYGLRLAWRGLQLLGIAFGIAGGWYVTAWVQHGRAPLIQSVVRAVSPYVRYGSEPDPIVPPQWLLAVVGSLTIIALFMMLLGTQDSTPKMNFKKDGKPNSKRLSVSLYGH